ncbi:hypothetical protein BDV96DRAFT_508906 [Lophiotrema nucula]|uniref:Rhodopsin domain-containing protein n=1 Tax=Lophiotrema nucula TaxID=690887 RepID=A0A6A5YGF6_9PLEO|nr:hypothetical protein BDV96DRAFT_508906 [Lophiotrema nucula]
MATHGPPDPHLIPAIPSAAAIDNARAMVGVTISLNIIAFLLWTGRIWTRTHPVFRLGADDYVISAAYVLVVVDSILLLLTMPYMFGRSPSSFTLADAQDSQRYAVLSQPIWAWAIAGIKISVLLMLLRLQTDRLWRRFCWGLITFVVCLTVYNMIAQLTQCIPLHKVWDLLGVVQGKCWGTAAVRSNLFAVATMTFLTDFIVALLPLTFLGKVQKPMREKAIIGVLMGLGIFAGVASILKMVFAANFGKTGDIDLDGIRIGMWSLIEELVGMIAACVPCLRSPFQRCLEYFGLVTTHPSKSTYGRGYGQVYESGALKGSRGARKSHVESAIKMKSLSRSGDAASEENILAGNGLDIKDREIWCTTEVTMEQEARQTPKLGFADGNGRAGWNDEGLRHE